MLISAQEQSPWYAELSPSFIKTVRLIGWMIRFTWNLRQKEKISGELQLWEIEKAEKTLLHLIQSDSFASNESVIEGLRVEMDNDKLIRVRTKLTNLPGAEGFRRPVLLPKNHPAVHQLIRSEHIRNKHAGLHIMMSTLREKYWIIHGRREVKKVTKKCVICRRFTSKKTEVPSAPLPQDRVKEAKVFQVVGIDLAGPLAVKNGTKCWIFYSPAPFIGLYISSW